MPDFIWKGINSYGEKRKGSIEAVDEAGARAQLKRRWGTMQKVLSSRDRQSKIVGDILIAMVSD